MPVTNVMGVNINYEDEGEGDPMLLIHGFSGNLLSWDAQATVLNDKYRVVRYDCRGHGGSESPDDKNKYSQQILVDEALGLMDILNLEKVNLCGLSMGGNVALNLAIQHPERVNSAIVASTGAGSDADDGFIEGFKILADILDKGDLESFTQVIMASPLSTNFLKLRPDLIELTKERAMSSHPKGLANTIRGVQMRRNSIFALEDQLRNLSVPVLVVVGELDTLCLQPAKFMKQNIPNSRIVVMSETGHIVNLERPAEFNREITVFLENEVCV